MWVFASRMLECIVGVDLGATWLRVARVDAIGSNLLRLPTPSRAEAKEAIDTAIRTIASGMRVRCLGVSRAPGVDEHGHVADWPSQPHWGGLPLLPWLRDAADAPVESADDGVCAALWEHHSRTSRTSHSITACLSLGTGLAIGIMAGNDLVSSGDGAETLSHHRFGDLHLSCKCGKQGCLQTVLSVEGLERMIKREEIALVRRSFAKFATALRSRFNVDTVVITGGGVERFGSVFLHQLLGECVSAAGANLEVSRTPALSAMGGALLLAADRGKQGKWWHARIEKFIRQEQERGLQNCNRTMMYGISEGQEFRI
jgi:predicted NBD/HSP70 family sugar kinase